MKLVISCLMALNNIFLFFFCRNVNQIWNTGKNWIFAILQRQRVCTASYSYRFKILVSGFLYKHLIWSLWRISTHTKFYKFALFTWLFSVWECLVSTLWLADFFPRLAAFDLAAVFWQGFWTSPANPANCHSPIPDVIKSICQWTISIFRHFDFSK